MHTSHLSNQFQLSLAELDKHRKLQNTLATWKNTQHLEITYSDNHLPVLRPRQEEVFFSPFWRFLIKSVSAVWRNTSADQRASGSKEKECWSTDPRTLTPHLLQTCWNPCLHSCCFLNLSLYCEQFLAFPLQENNITEAPRYHSFYTAVEDK